jgi:hypothetical protein
MDKLPGDFVFDFEAACRKAKEPGYWEDLQQGIETLRGQLSDRRVDDLLDGMQRIRERTLVPLEQREDDPLFSRTEILYVMLFLRVLAEHHFGQNCLATDDLKEAQPEVYQKCRELDLSLSNAEARRFTEIMVVFLEYLMLVRQARTGFGFDVYHVMLEPLVDWLRGFATDQQLAALVEKIKAQMEGKSIS